MIKYLAATLLLACGAASLVAQQTDAVHRWTPVLKHADVRVELDTASVKSVDHQRRVWLRWTFPTPVPDFADVEIERRDIDCARSATRTLATRDVSLFDGATSGAALVVNDSSTVWIHPSRGSLEAEVVEAICG
jgi:hypothetical protein